MKKSPTRTYKTSDVVSFRRAKGTWGVFSNMASAYPLKINNLEIKSSEALYQALKFSNAPDVQVKILIEKSPFNAKAISRKYNGVCRSDWGEIKIKAMRFCLQAKLAQHYDTFGKALKESWPKDIVEYSPSDAFWGAVPNDNYLVGVNALGRLLMELRADMAENRRNVFEAELPSIDNFKLLGRPISPIKIAP